MYSPQLDTFIRVAEAGSFSKAAQEALVSPTAVIKQMNLLESRLGFKLFHRSHQGLTLTKAGESFLKDTKNLIRYSRESIARARMAERVERRIIRVGISPLIPSLPLMNLWSKAKKHCPSMNIQVVTCENSLEAARSLANLGQNIDIVVDVFDDGFLKEHKYAGLELAREQVCCAVPLDSSLSNKECITLNDLHGHSLMLITRGWNKNIDCIRDKIQEGHPEITIVDFPQYHADVFNRAANENLAIATLPIWREAHPLLKTIPTNWNTTLSCSILCSPKPSILVQEFLNAVKMELKS